MHESFGVTAPFLTPVAVITSLRAFTDALNVVADTSVVAERLDRAKLSVFYVLLLRFEEMQSFVHEHKLTWPLPATQTSKQQVYNEFARVYAHNGMTHLSEGGHDLRWLHTQVFGQ